jgi:hypothetical protein
MDVRNCTTLSLQNYTTAALWVFSVFGLECIFIRVLVWRFSIALIFREGYTRFQISVLLTCSCVDIVDIY